MVIFKKFFLVFCAALLAVSGSFVNCSAALAEGEELSQEEMIKWLTEGTDKLMQLAERKFVPIRVLVVTAMDKKSGPSIMKIDPTLFNQFGMFRLVESNDLSWSFLINKALRIKPKKGPAEFNNAMQRIFGMSGADLVAYASEKSDDPWSIRIDDGSEIRAVATVAQIPKKREIGEIYEWILESLGYNGIVLDQRHDFFLAAARPGNLIQGVQAVVLGDSAGKTSISQKDKSGTALLKLVVSSGIFGVFKLTFQKPGKPDPKLGDKLSVSK